MDKETIERVARLAHEAGRNHGAALDNESQLPWEDLSDERREVARARVRAITDVVTVELAAAVERAEAIERGDVVLEPVEASKETMPTIDEFLAARGIKGDDALAVKAFVEPPKHPDETARDAMFESVVRDVLKDLG